MPAAGSLDHHGRIRNVVAWVAFWPLAALAAQTWAQTTKPTPDSETPPDLIAYSDPTFGFEMRVPAGWSYERGRFEGPERAIGLLRGRGPRGLQALQVLIYRTFEVSSFSQWLDTFAKRLAELHGLSKITEKRWPNDPRGRAVLIADAKVAASRTLTYHLCIPFDPHTVWVLVFASTVPGPDEEAQVQARFDKIASSVQVLYDPLEADKLAAAFERGLKVLRELRAGAEAVNIDATERFYDIVVADKSIGYLSRWMKREAHTFDDPRYGGRGKPGLRVHEESWRFADDGTVRHTDLNMFSSFDLESELIENRMTQVPAPDLPSQQLYIELDQCVRAGKTLVSSFSTNVDLDLPEPHPPIPIGPRYLNLAWSRLLPRLLLAAPPETYAFALYDSQTRALIVYTIQPLGPCEIPSAGGRPGYAFETREGFVSHASRLYTDQDGQVVRVQSGNLVVMQTTKDEIERKYAAQREPARRRMSPRPRVELP